MARILIVDDSDVVRHIICTQLERYGYAVCEARDAESALVIVREQPEPHIILLDYMLPGMDGLDFLRTIRHRNCCTSMCSIPVVMMTGYESINLAVEFMQLGGADFVTKPIRNYEILDFTLRRVIDTQKARCDLAKAEAAQWATEETNRLILEFVAKMNHELVTPGQFIANGVRYIRHALKKGDFEKAGRWLDTIETSNHRLIRMTTDILDCSRLRHHKLELKRTDVGIRHIVDTALAEKRECAVGKNITITTEMDDIIISVDPDRLGQILANLLSNAIRYAPDGGVIRVTAHRADDIVTFSVVDTGPGVRDDLKPYIFEEFRQDVEAREVSGALGLGLAICRGLVELHGGTITVSDNHPSGAIFTFTIPTNQE